MENKLAALRQELWPMIKLATPLVAAEVGWMTMGIVDTMMVGRLPESAAAMGAVSLGGTLFMTIGIFGGGLLLGLDTLVAQAFGASRVDDCHHSLLNGIYLALAMTPALMGALWLVIPLLAGWGIDPSVLREGVPYLKAITWSTPPLLLYFACRRYLQGMNLVRPVAFALVTANLVNVVVNWMLIYGHLGAPAMGVEGAGWATCFSRVYMAGVLGIYIVWHDRRYGTGLWYVARRPDWPRVRQLLALGFPAALQLTLEFAVFAVVTAMIGKLGALPLAAHQVALNTVSFTYMMPLGVSSAAAVRVGQAVGRGDAPGASRAGWTAILLGAGLMSGAAAGLWLAPRAIARIYTPDAQVIAMGAALLIVAAFFQLFDGIQVVATGALRGVGDTRTPMFTHIFCYWAIGLPLGAWLGFQQGWGVAGLWIGLSTALIAIGLVLLLAWNRQVHALARGIFAPAARRVDAAEGLPLE